jgi:hypothetical protein
MLYPSLATKKGPKKTSVIIYLFYFLSLTAFKTPKYSEVAIFSAVTKVNRGQNHLFDVLVGVETASMYLLG